MYSTISVVTNPSYLVVSHQNILNAKQIVSVFLIRFVSDIKRVDNPQVHLKSAHQFHVSSTVPFFGANPVVMLSQLCISPTQST
jgi:hypothetical protein